MNLCISNIAWNNEIDEEIYKLMKKFNFTWIEIAPIKTLWEIDNINIEQINEYINKLNYYWIKPVAMQSILFWKNNIHLFEGASSKILNDYMLKIIDLAKILNINSIIFGSPKNRIIPKDMQYNKALEIWIKFFKKIWEYAYKNNTNVCIEPNPDIYGWNFLLTTEETLNFVKSIDSKWCKIHIDIWSIIANNENLEDSIINSLPYATHIHLSQPYLEPLDINNDIRKKTIQIALKNNYKWFFSIEMKNTDIKNIEKILNKIYNISLKCQQ